MGNSADWQERVLRALEDVEGIALNPRRWDWDASWVQTFESADFRRQVEWELEGMEAADLIVMHFDPATKSPVTLLELGLWARAGQAGGPLFRELLAEGKRRRRLPPVRGPSGHDDGTACPIRPGEGSELIVPSLTSQPIRGKRECERCEGKGTRSWPKCTGVARLPAPSDLSRTSNCRRCAWTDAHGDLILFSCPSCAGLGLQVVPAGVPDAVLR